MAEYWLYIDHWSINKYYIELRKCFTPKESLNIAKYFEGGEQWTHWKVFEENTTFRIEVHFNPTKWISEQLKS